MSLEHANVVRNEKEVKLFFRGRPFDDTLSSRFMPGVPSLICDRACPDFAEAPSEAEGEAEGAAILTRADHRSSGDGRPRPSMRPGCIGPLPHAIISTPQNLCHSDRSQPRPAARKVEEPVFCRVAHDCPEQSRRVSPLLRDALSS